MAVRRRLASWVVRQFYGRLAWGYDHSVGTPLLVGSGRFGMASCKTRVKKRDAQQQQLAGPVQLQCSPASR